MSGRPASAVVVCALVALAGCSAGTPTVTPAPVPEAGEPAGSALAPGLSEAGVVDPLRLESAHHRALTEAGFRRRTTETVTREGGTVYRSVETVRAAAGRDRYNLSVRQRTSTDYSIRPFVSRAEVWGNRSARVVRLVQVDGINYRVDRDGPPPEGELTDSTRVVALLDAFAVRVSQWDGENGSYQLTSTRLVAPAALDPPPQVEEVRNASLSAVVTGEGIVRRYRVHYEGIVDDGRVTVTLTGRVSGVGATTVPTPDWANAALRTNASMEGRGTDGPETP